MVDSAGKISKGLISNKNIRFISFRYLIYAVQFVNSIFIAKYLGPYLFGIWGFILLVVQYLTQINLGIPHALNVKLATFEGKDGTQQVNNFSNALLLMLLHSLFIFLLICALSFTQISILVKYNFYQFLFFAGIIAILQNLGLVFVCIYRIKNLLQPITLYQACVPLLSLLVCFFWEGEKLLYALLYSQLLAYIFCLFVFVKQSPIQIKLKYQKDVLLSLLKSGLALLLYSASFYFIMIITRTFVSYYYRVEDLGFFSFALSLAQAVFLALDTISFLIFPKLINRFKYQQGAQLYSQVEVVRKNYTIAAYLLIFGFMLGFPVVMLFLPEYASSYKSFALLAISMAMLSSSFGISTLLIAFNRELLLGKIAFAALAINFLIAWILAKFSVSFFMIGFAPLIAYFVYSLMLEYFYNAIFIEKKRNFSFKRVFNFRLLVPALLLLAGILLDIVMLQPLAYALLLILNYRDILGLKELAITLIKNPSVFKI
ncbi:oligosaccharide flippase family protein [Panacibacter sp. DH6]|uniref:Oligosaccharide flippase family protein n=1 Tax=Panacibacter microcysteis TaxID=2793269 RepID=A0A931E8L7_9BACT|nr:oligosaccharide flippase family protein [Panacibacter microcysteis]MBG9375736.1 oligosaccharide flippase family protein [Panacibacter microcysteis]